MSTTDPLTSISTRVTPQHTQADPRQEKNAAGGYVFVADAMTRFRRFLATGVEGGTYYASERDHTIENAQNVIDLARTRGEEMLDVVIEASLGGHTLKQHPLMYSLAALVSLPEDATKRRALDALPRLARTATHLFLFAKYVEQFRGWGRGLKRGIGAWYLDMEPGRLAYQMTKYQNREGFTHRDMLRLAHPKGDGEHARLFDFACGRLDAYPDGIDSGLPEVIVTSERLRKAASIDMVLGIIRESSNVSWEMVPSQWLGDKRVWEALLDGNHVPIGALLRNLARLTANGVIDPMGVDDRTSKIIGRLRDAETLKAGRVHPMSVLLAAGTYRTGRSLRGDSTWHPVSNINKALDVAFRAAFGSIEIDPNTRASIGIDVSGSMDSATAGTGLSCREAAAALGQVYALQFPRNMGLKFTGPYGGRHGGLRGGMGYHSTSNPQENAVEPFDLDPTRRVSDIIDEARQTPFGRTDCALPILDAMKRGVGVDCFIIITDNETWAGDIHPHQALKQYRERTGIPARMVTVAMQANNSTIADPSDPGMLDVVGLDMSSVNLVADFAQGHV